VKVDHLDRMVRGWFVGDFDPTLYRTSEVEIAVKRYQAGEHEQLHHHAIATELTVIVSGTACMGGRNVAAGEIVTLEPGEASDFSALTDVTAVTVKIPGAKDDKYVHDI
jgi:mannose-6-phosphate isomerase-like protein (cupin superfamily)